MAVSNRLKRLAGLAAVAALALAPGAQAKPSDAVRLDGLRAQFLYQTTGALSEDLLQTPSFAIWNTVIGEGGAKEPAQDILVSAVLKSGNAEDLTGKLTLAVISGRKLLSRHTFHGGLMKHGQLVQSILLHDATCGTIRIEARYGTQRKAATLDMPCGE